MLYFPKAPGYREPKSISWKQNLILIMESEEEVEFDTLYEWIKSIASLVNGRKSVFSATMSARCISVFDNADVATALADLNDKYAVVPADKASINIVFVC